MTLKHFALFASALLLALAVGATAQAKTYSVVKGGAQFQIGGGLPLPIAKIQTTKGSFGLGGGPPTYGGTVFPPLGIPKKVGFQTVMGTTNMGVQQKLSVPQGVLFKSAAQLTLGQFLQNPALFAVATNASFEWPAAAAVFSTGARTGAKTTTVTTAVSGGNIAYSNVLASKFGGPAQFRVSSPGGLGQFPNVPVTLFGIAVPGPGNPPCTHTALGGPNPACVAGLAQAIPTVTATPNATAKWDQLVVGGPMHQTGTTPNGATIWTGTSMTTPGGTPNALISTVTPNGVNGPGPQPGVGIGKFGPAGTVSVFVNIGGTKRGFTNMANTVGFPWTTGMLVISAPAAFGLPEIFTITGMDGRSAGGDGTIQMVSGAVGRRVTSGPNANRGWVSLELSATDGIPAMSTSKLAAGAGLMLLVGAYAVRRFNR